MAAIDQDIIGVSRTVYGAYLQSIKTLGLPFTLVPNTTLNERLGVQAGVTPSAGVVPNMRYLAIGNQGHFTVTADDGSEETVPVPHRADDAGLYNQIPFVLREVTDDLTAAERANYGLRVLESHGGKNYIAYYLRRFDLAGVVPQLQRVEVIDNVITTTPLVPTTDNLNPTRPTIPNNGVVVGSNSSVSASAIIQVVLGPNDISEILNAHRIRTGSTRSPVISEIALCSGVDKEVQGSSGGSGTFMYNEAICVQVNAFVSTYHAIGYSSNGARFTLDIGGVEPLIAESDVLGSEII